MHANLLILPLKQASRIFCLCLSLYLFLPVLATQSHAQVAKLYPVDEALQDSSLLAFRNNLIDIALKEDTKLFKSIVHEDCKLYYLPAYGLENVDELLGREKLRKKFFSEVVSILNHGGKFVEKDKFFTSYVFACWPERLDAFTLTVVTNQNVPVYAEPDSNSNAIDSLSYDIVEMYDESFRERSGHKGWDRIKLSHGRGGFIDKEYTLSPLGLRLGFMKEEGSWGLNFAVSGAEPPSPQLKLYPEDQADRDSSFLVFRNRLHEAIENQDTVFIYSILNPKIRPTFGHGGGLEEFITYWKFRQGNSGFWDTMKEILSMGGAFINDSTFVAPYVSAKWPGIEYRPEPFAFTNVIEENVKAYEEPDSNSTVLKILSFDIVRIPRDWWKWGDWIKIILNDGREAFMLKQYQRSPTGYRAWFLKENGSWRIRFFIAGD